MTQLPQKSMISSPFRFTVPPESRSSPFAPCSETYTTFAFSVPCTSTNPFPARPGSQMCRIRRSVVTDAHILLCRQSGPARQARQSVTQILRSTTASGPTESSPCVRSPIITPLAVKVELPVIMISPPFTTLPKPGSPPFVIELRRLSRCRRRRRRKSDIDPSVSRQMR